MSFTILTIHESSSNLFLETTLDAFLAFYQALTPKHKIKVFFQILSDDDCPAGLCNKIASHSNIAWLKPNKSLSDVRVHHPIKEADVLLLTTNHQQERKIQEAFLHGVPVVSLIGHQTSPMIDISCGVRIKASHEEMLKEELTRHLLALYFDGEALQAMKRNAKRKALSMVAIG